MDERTPVWQEGQMLESAPTLAEELRRGPLAFLRAPTAPGWAAQALADLPALMNDHAWCERKASGNCLSLLSAHTDFPAVAEPMIRLAREELEHFHLVFNYMSERGMALRPERRDHYVRELRGQVRTDRFQLMDRLIVAAVIEARSCERLGLIAQALPAMYPAETVLADFYARLTRAEARHFQEFTSLAAEIFGETAASARLSLILDFEAELIQRSPWACAVH